MNQPEFEVNACNQRQARENACDHVMIGFGFASHWLKKWSRFVNQSQGVVKQNQRITKLFSTLNCRFSLSRHQNKNRKPFNE